ncbi:phage scaffolding protein [Clostridium botulinum]|uniref:phage scaffolding protein n=1 Tax=Clostridium botulinum TaxID=1491 RepID=UPI001967D338|nr:phage scaffolding protein [Clostridium botulinum]MBN1058522.1 phage capsid protein [Clostridium botulinum]
MAHIKHIIGEDAFNALSEDKRKELGKKDFEDVSNGAYIPKTRFDQVNEQAKEYKKQVGERDKQITDLKDEFKDAKGLKEKVEELETKNKTQKEDYEGQIKEINFNNALKTALVPYKCKDEDYLMSKINKDAIKVNDDGTIVGLVEQVDTFKKAHDYLFEKEISGTSSFTSGSTGGEGENKPQEEKEDIAVRLGKQQAESIKTNEGFNKFIAK